LAKFERSLERLGLEFVDILYLHQASRAEAAVFEPLLKALEGIKRSGRARSIGVSTHQREPEVIRAAAESGVYDVVLTSYNFRQPHSAGVREAIAGAASKGLGVIAMKAMAGVYWDAERRLPIDAAAALRWVLSDPNVDTCLAGFATLEELDVAVQVLREPDLTERDRKALRQGEDRGLAGLFCLQCGDCRGQCRLGADVPAWMRGYMYAYGYRTPARAKEVLGRSLGAPSCRSCAACPVRCRMGFDVRARILDLARLSDVPDVFLA
ncbi:MAG TPA: aldo/keto reductase, partial [Acidobacteriota bacterium]|nr:aldo/keto reductase [Acidobacteriota bacterium]